MALERNDDGFSIDASLLGELLDLPPSDVQALMRRSEITSLCERGEAEDAGQYRLTFFHKGRRARLKVDESGRIVHRSIIDYGERPRPPPGSRDVRDAGQSESCRNRRRIGRVKAQGRRMRWSRRS